VSGGCIASMLLGGRNPFYIRSMIHTGTYANPQSDPNLYKSQSLLHQVNDSHEKTAFLFHSYKESQSLLHQVNDSHQNRLWLFNNIYENKSQSLLHQVNDSHIPYFISLSRGQRVAIPSTSGQ